MRRVIKQKKVKIFNLKEIMVEINNVEKQDFRIYSALDSSFKEQGCFEFLSSSFEGKYNS